MKIYYISANKYKKQNRLMQKMYLSLLACSYSITAHASTLDKMDSTCENALRIGQRMGYWVCIFMCLYEIIKKVKDGDTNAIWGILVKYSIAYSAVFMIRFVLDMIGEWFV